MAGKFYTYLNDCPDDFVKSFDVLLKLDDDSKLPAHSQTLARFSGVCAGMLAGGPLSNISASKKATLPLSDCSTATVISLLSVLYAPPSQPMEHINRESSMAIARLAHKLDMQVTFPGPVNLRLSSQSEPRSANHGIPDTGREASLQIVVRLCDDVISGAAQTPVFKSGDAMSSAFLQVIQT